MGILKVNETPVRTSRNFKINNVKLEDITLPENLEKFDGIRVDGDCKIEENVVIPNLKYGLGDALYQNVLKHHNSAIKVSGKNVKLDFTFDEKSANLVSYVEIVAQEDMNIVIKYSSATNCKCFANSIIKLFANENVKVNVTIINLLNEQSQYFVAMENEIDNNSEVGYTIIDLGAKNSVQNYYSNMIGENAKNDLKSIYLGLNDQLKDINYIADLYGKKTIVNIDVQGALNDNAKKNFKGTIDFKKGCKKAKGDENEYCMLLSKKAKSIALPMLLCTEDDVEGNHATASGKLDDKEIFYIMSRGLDKKEATKLIVKARLNSIIERIVDESLRNEIVEEIDRRLD